MNCRLGMLPTAILGNRILNGPEGKRVWIFLAPSVRAQTLEAA